MLRPGELLIGDHVPVSHPHLEDGAKGCIPRDYMAMPHRAYESLQMPVIPRSEWSERARDMIATESRLSDFRLRGNYGRPIPSLNQNSPTLRLHWGYCWKHSGTHANMLVRAAMGLPYVALSAFCGAAIMKHAQNQGGWGAQGLEWSCTKGDPSQEFWPQQSVDLKLWTPECQANALLYRITETWADTAAPAYSRNLSFEQEATCYFCRTPGIKDENWWGHSICGLDMVDGAAQRGVTRGEGGKLLSLHEFDLAWGMNDSVTGGWGVRIWNSWGDEWGDRGMSVLTGSKAVSDGASAPRVATAI